MNIGYQRAADPSRYSAVILAAGLSSRMNAFKPLLPVDGRPALVGLVETLRGAGINDILVVTGHRREELQEDLALLRVRECHNENYERGMFSSIQAGLAEAVSSRPDAAGYFLVPVDCPLITIRAIRELMSAADADADPKAGRFYAPTFEGKKGHPLLIPRVSADEILEHDGEGGLKAVTDRHWDQMVRVPVPDEEILLDMDTPEGYEAVKDFVAHGFRREKLEVLSSRKRIILVRHGQTVQHDEPMFIGQYDVPLSDEGRAQAAALGDEIADLIRADVIASQTYVEGVSIGKEPLPPIEAVYCSDLARAEETANIIADRIRASYGGNASEGASKEGAAEPAAEINVMNAMTGMLQPRALQPVKVDVRPREDLREIDLGEWDGRPIREIKEEMPELYERRGKDLFTFKTGNKSENFYDMQYRTVAALRDILADDYARNVVIVAHSGVLRALENNLKGIRVDDDWDPIDKGTYRIWT